MFNEIIKSIDTIDCNGLNKLLIEVSMFNTLFNYKQTPRVRPFTSIGKVSSEYTLVLDLDETLVHFDPVSIKFH